MSDDLTIVKAVWHFNTYLFRLLSRRNNVVMTMFFLCVIPINLCANNHEDSIVKAHSGYVLLLQDKSFAEQIKYPNTIYEIRYNYNLNNEVITIPVNCKLRFSGGVISNGTIVGNNTAIIAGDFQIFDKEVLLSGHWSTNTINVCWFGAKNDVQYNSTDAFKAANESAWSIAKKKPEYEMYGETGTIKLVIPNGVYYISGSKIFGSVRDSDEYPSFNTNFQYHVDGNNSILYWEVNKQDDVLFGFDYTIGHQTVKGLKIFVVNNTQDKYAGVIFRIGNRIPSQQVAGRVYNDAGLAHYTDVHVTNSRKGKGCIYKVFDVLGTGQCDQALVERCSFDAFKYCYYNINAEAVSWNFETCSFYTTVDDAKYFYITRLSQYLMVNNSAFSYCDGQTLCEYNCDVNSQKKLVGSDRDNIIFNNTRFEGLKRNKKNWFVVFKGTAGKIILDNCNFDASSSYQFTHKFLISDLGSVQINNCTMAKALFTIPKYTTHSFGLGNQNNWAITSTNLRTDSLYIKGYDWDNDRIIDITEEFLSSGNYFRFADFRDLRGKSSGGSKLQSFYITPSKDGNVQFEERKYIVTFGESPSSRHITLPPFSVVRKIELYDSSTLPSNVNKIRIYAGGKSKSIYTDVALDINKNVGPCVQLFNGRIVVFNEDITKQTIYCAFIDKEGNEIGTIRGLVAISYIPLTNPTHYGIKRQTAIIEKE